mgnify:CR=1 FL=1
MTLVSAPSISIFTTTLFYAHNKFIAEDVVLFDNLFMDLFPDCEEPQVNTDVLQLGIEDTLNAHKL